MTKKTKKKIAKRKKETWSSVLRSVKEAIKRSELFAQQMEDLQDRLGLLLDSAGDSFHLQGTLKTVYEEFEHRKGERYE